MPAILRPVRDSALLAGAALAALPALAHHPMGGAVPATAWQGLLSGFGHPLIGPDHLLFLLGAAAIAAGSRTRAGHAGLLLLLYAVAGALGTAVRVAGDPLPLAEAGVAASLLLAAPYLLRRTPPGAAAAALLTAAAGFVHGHAYGEAVIGTEAAPLGWYLAGLAAVQALLLVAAFTGLRVLAGRRPRACAWASRGLAAAVASAGLWLLGLGAAA